MKALQKLHRPIVGYLILVGQRWTQLSRIICIRTFNPPNECLLTLTSTMNRRINSGQEGTSIMPNGWIRYASFPRLVLINTTNDRINSADVVDEYRRRIYTMDGSHWLAQAHDIFNYLDITWGFEAFGIVPFPSNVSIVLIISLSFYIWHPVLSRGCGTNRQFTSWLSLFVPLIRPCSRNPKKLPNSRPASILVSHPIRS